MSATAKSSPMPNPAKLSLLVLSVSLFGASCATTPGVGWDHLPAILENIRAPEFPDRNFDVASYGAKADAKTDCTEAIRKAIAACHEAGGGRVVIAGAGTYCTGPIHLKSNVHLEVAKGATLSFSDRFMDYLPPVLVRWEGVE